METLIQIERWETEKEIAVCVLVWFRLLRVKGECERLFSANVCGFCALFLTFFLASFFLAHLLSFSFSLPHSFPFFPPLSGFLSSVGHPPSPSPSPSHPSILSFLLLHPPSFLLPFFFHPTYHTPIMSSPDEVTSLDAQHDKYVGLMLAVSSSLMIGISFVITKKGLIDSTSRHSGQGSASDQYLFLKNPIWLLGMLTSMAVHYFSIISLMHIP